MTRMRTCPQKARHVTPHLTVLRSLCHPLTHSLAPTFLQGHFGVSASTGSFSDTHVVYSFQLADLEDGDIHEVEATPYTGARDMGRASNSDDIRATRSLPASHGASPMPSVHTGADKTSHRVHLDSKSHETHVKVSLKPATTYCEARVVRLPTAHLSPLTTHPSHAQVANHPANLDGDAKGAMAHASEEASHAAAAPPSLDDGSKMLGKISDQMAGVRLSLQGIRGGLNNTRFTVDRLAETAQKTLAAATDGASRQIKVETEVQAQLSAILTHVERFADGGGGGGAAPVAKLPGVRRRCRRRPRLAAPEATLHRELIGAVAKVEAKVAAEGQAVVAATAKTVLDADAKRAGDLKSLKDNLHSGMLQISQEQKDISTMKASVDKIARAVDNLNANVNTIQQHLTTLQKDVNDRKEAEASGGGGGGAFARLLRPAAGGAVPVRRGAPLLQEQGSAEREHLL